MLSNQLIAGIVSEDFFPANWGIRPDEMNLTDMSNRYLSLVTNLKNSSLIQQVLGLRSWGTLSKSNWQVRLR